MLKVYDPLWVGVPLTAAPDIVNPGGRLPVLILNVYGGVPPVALNGWL
jgi:hypothetical protein